jgi:hypothetical protein
MIVLVTAAALAQMSASAKMGGPAQIAHSLRSRQSTKLMPMAAMATIPQYGSTPPDQIKVRSLQRPSLEKARVLAFLTYRGSFYNT